MSSTKHLGSFHVHLHTIPEPAPSDPRGSCVTQSSSIPERSLAHTLVIFLNTMQCFDYKVYNIASCDLARTETKIANSYTKLL